MSVGGVSLRRRVHVGAVIGYAFFLYVLSPMNLLVIGWFADFEDAISHRVHEVSIGALFTLGFVGVVAQLRRGDRATAAIQSVVALVVAAGVITSSTGFEPLVLAYLLPPLLIIALDPEWRTIVAPPLHREIRLLVFAALLLLLIGPDVVNNFAKATLLVQGHESHWGAMAAFAVAVTLLAFVAGFRPPGWRLAAWSVVAAVVVSASVSIAFRYDASALGVSHSIAMVLWAAGFAATVSLVGSRHPERIPVRHRDQGLVAGVATAVAPALGWPVGWVRSLFAIPVLGGVAYAVLWLALPAAGRAERGRGRTWLLGGLLAVAMLSMASGFDGSVIGFGMLMLAGLSAIALAARPLASVVLRRTRIGTALARMAAGIGLGAALIAVAVVWTTDDLGAPVVPHRILSDSVEYCVTCHANPGVARGAPVWPDIFEHSGGERCVSCHDSLEPEPTPSASWWPR